MAINKVVVLVVVMVTMKLVPMMVKDMSGTKMMVIIWRKCFRALGQRLY